MFLYPWIGPPSSVEYFHAVVTVLHGHVAVAPEKFQAHEQHAYKHGSRLILRMHQCPDGHVVVIDGKVLVRRLHTGPAHHGKFLVQGTNSNSRVPDCRFITGELENKLMPKGDISGTRQRWPCYLAEELDGSSFSPTRIRKSRYVRRRLAWSRPGYELSVIAIALPTSSSASFTMRFALVTLDSAEPGE